MKLISENEPFSAAVGGPFTAKFAVIDEATGAVLPIEGIATAFLRAPREGEYTLGFGDQVSFDSENMDADAPDVDGKLQVTFQIPRYTIKGPTDTSLDMSVLAMDRSMKTAPTVVNQSFPMTLTPAVNGGAVPTETPAPPTARPTPPAKEKPKPVVLDPAYDRAWSAISDAQQAAGEVGDQALVDSLEAAKDEIRVRKGEKRTMPRRP